MWGLFDKGRTILIEFSGSMAVHPGGEGKGSARDPLLDRMLQELGLSSWQEPRGQVCQRASHNRGMPTAHSQLCQDFHLVQEDNVSVGCADGPGCW